MARFDGKVVVVTGGGLGFGRAYSLGLASEGATVVIADINMDNAMQTQAAIEELGGKAVVIQTDVSDEASVLAMRDQVDRELGGIDGLVNNAGIYPMLAIDDVTKEHWDQIYNINVWGSFVTARAVAESMKRRGGGSIVNISSGTFLRPPANQPAYVSSKGAIIALTRSLATELANDGIRVNTVLPGLTATPGIMGSPDFSEEFMQSRVDLQLIKRQEQADDTVGAAMFLLSDDASFVTGQSMLVNGGGSML